MIFIENCNKILTTQYGDITGLNPENTMHSVSLPARHNQIFSNFALILGIFAKPDKNVKLIRLKIRKSLSYRNSSPNLHKLYATCS